MKMPAIFLGHGSPMNAIDDNEFTREWDALGKKFKPKAILMISAHWFTDGTLTQDDDSPRVINDMYGFPSRLYELNYQARGSRELTGLIQDNLSKPARISNDWGIDHGAWSVLAHMYPQRDIPVVQLSVDARTTPEKHFAMGRELRQLRERGIMIIGSGNIVHNLRKIDLSRHSGFDWSRDFDTYIRDAVSGGSPEKVLNYRDAGEAASLAVPTTDHFDPLLYVLGASNGSDSLRIFNEAQLMGSISMTSYLFE